MRQSARAYEEAGHRVLANRTWARAVAAEAFHHLRPLEELGSEYVSLEAQTKSINFVINQVQFWVTGLVLSAVGAHIKSPDPAAIDLHQPLPAWLRQRAYMALLRFLVAKGEKELTVKKLEEYRTVRKEILKHVPHEFHTAFLNHSEFSPDLIKID